jgi:hypothetical protein
MLKHILDPLTKSRRSERVYLWYTNKKKEKQTFPVLCIAYYGSEWVQPSGWSRTYDLSDHWMAGVRVVSTMAGDREGDPETRQCRPPGDPASE